MAGLGDPEPTRTRSVFERFADDLLDRLRQPPHQRGDGQDLVAAGELGDSAERSIISIS
jgi:hypothetical protein